MSANGSPLHLDLRIPEIQKSKEHRMRRPEEILEIAEILDEAADRLAAALERSGADELHPPQVLREIAHYELDLAAADVAAWTFGTKIPGPLD
jgi:hypothetical protein